MQFLKLRNQKGQMAIFIALFFQVLFVFFAMSINVALVVHDKINLQNSVDLAVYYGAQKQAEVLNVIAHVNYQIRQSWKLLAWRYQVLGTMGLDVHPQQVRKNITDSIFASYRSGSVLPVLCASGQPIWIETPGNESHCREERLDIPHVPNIEIIANFDPINKLIESLHSGKHTTNIRVACEELGAYNYWFGASILKAFREDQKNRKQLIYALANQLSAGNDFLDLDGNSVKRGVDSVIRKNLTKGHKNSELSGVKIQLFNSLRGQKPKDWLSEVSISPMIFYADSRQSNPPDCSTEPQVITALPSMSGSRAFINRVDPSGLLTGFTQAEVIQGGGFENELYNYSLGVEKNPWVLAYIGVKAESTVRQLFSPFGSPLKLVATAFAKPFGGRIGPWYGRNWDPGAKKSSGGPMDPLVPERVDFSNLGGVDPNSPRRLPNFSRYPGDSLGLNSRLAQGEIANLFYRAKIRRSYYDQISWTFKEDKDNDILPWDHKNNNVPAIRQYELAAIAPDLFDITYYSIEPKFDDNYVVRLENLRKQGVLGSMDVPIRGDLGWRAGAVGPDLKDIINENFAEKYYHANVNYKVKNWKHLLTSWLPGEGVFNSFVSGESKISNFGACRTPAKQSWPQIPSSCVAGGGRTGYSVKLVSGPFLRTPLRLGGGTGSARAPILNPPPQPEEW